MSNRKIILNPANWVLDENNKVSFRYRILTDDFNIRSAYSPTYSIEVPQLIDPSGNGVFTDVDYVLTKEVSGANTLIRISWTTAPQYDNLGYFIFLNNEYIQTSRFASFSYVATSAGTYTFKISLPNTTKTPLANTVLFTATTTV